MFWRPYVSVAERRRSARQRMEKLKKKGVCIQPVEIDGRTIARSFWGKAWCEHLESFSDYENRLPRGRTYVRNGSVCHLEITAGRIEAMVSGSDMYTVTISIDKLKSLTWKAIQKQCAGQIGSMLELLQGKLSSQVMAIVTDRKNGLFPHPGEIKLGCSCPDWAVMCKHVAAVLYGIGRRLDSRPDLLFLLRDVDAQELISADIALPDIAGKLEETILADTDLSNIFGIDLEADDIPKTTASVKPQKVSRKERIKAESRSLVQALKTSTAKRSARSKSSKNDSKSSESAKSVGPETTIKNRKAAIHTIRKEKSDIRKEKSVRTVRGGRKKSPSLPLQFEATGECIAMMRRHLNLTVEDFAALVGVSTPTVNRWEKEADSLTLRSRTEQALKKLHRKILNKAKP